MVLPRQIVNGRFRENLSQADIRFVVTSLTKNGNEADGLMRLLTDDAMRNAILDSPVLFEALKSSQETLPISAELYFYILLRQGLKAEGIDNTNVAAYTAAMLAAPVASMTQAADGKKHERKPFDYTCDMIEALNHSKGYEWFCLATAIADQSLLLTGMFSDLLYARKTRRAAPGLNYYETVGRNHYRTASQHRLAEEFELKETLLTLSESFPVVRGVLTKIRADYMRLGAAAYSN